MANKYLKNGELQDEKIKKALEQSAIDYSNGELLEVVSELQEIIYAIVNFTNNY